MSNLQFTLSLILGPDGGGTSDGIVLVVDCRAATILLTVAAGPVNSWVNEQTDRQHSLI